MCIAIDRTVEEKVVADSEDVNMVQAFGMSTRTTAENRDVRSVAVAMDRNTVELTANFVEPVDRRDTTRDRLCAEQKVVKVAATKATVEIVASTTAAKIAEDREGQLFEAEVNDEFTTHKMMTSVSNTMMLTSKLMNCVTCLIQCIAIMM